MTQLSGVLGKSTLGTFELAKVPGAVSPPVGQVEKIPFRDLNMTTINPVW